MSTQNILIAIVAVALLGLGAWYFGSMDKGGEAPREESTNTADNEDSTDEINESSGGAAKSSTASEGVSAQATVSNENSIEKELAEIDTLNAHESDYDDSDLDATFSSVGANSLTESYEY